jgi:hypothetical protein
MSTADPAIVAESVREQVTEVALICNRILVTTGAFDVDSSTPSHLLNHMRQSRPSCRTKW